MYIVHILIPKTHIFNVLEIIKAFDITVKRTHFQVQSCVFIDGRKYEISWVIHQ